MKRIGEARKKEEKQPAENSCFNIFPVAAS